MTVYSVIYNAMIARGRDVYTIRYPSCGVMTSHHAISCSQPVMQVFRHILETVRHATRVLDSLNDLVV